MIRVLGNLWLKSQTPLALQFSRVYLSSQHKNHRRAFQSNYSLSVRGNNWNVATCGILKRRTVVTFGGTFILPSCWHCNLTRTRLLPLHFPTLRVFNPPLSTKSFNWWLFNFLNVSEQHIKDICSLPVQPELDFVDRTCLHQQLRILPWSYTIDSDKENSS